MGRGEKGSSEERCRARRNAARSVHGYRGQVKTHGPSCLALCSLPRVVIDGSIRPTPAQCVKQHHGRRDTEDAIDAHARLLSRLPEKHNPCVGVTEAAEAYGVRGEGGAERSVGIGDVVPPARQDQRRRARPALDHSTSRSRARPPPAGRAPENGQHPRQCIEVLPPESCARWPERESSAHVVEA